jgi:Cyclophilin type peptidyl-prolyl cis-trans isomerase/CLD
VRHMLTLFRSGCFNSNHFFRVDKGFVAQTADVVSGSMARLSPMQRREAIKTVPLEVVDGVQHHEGTLSMARSSDPNSGTSSFSVLLGAAPHLNMQYTVFGCGAPLAHWCPLAQPFSTWASCQGCKCCCGRTGVLMPGVHLRKAFCQ